MRHLKLLLAISLSLGLVTLLNIPLQSGKLSIPPIGKLLSPFSGFWQNAASKDFNFPSTLSFDALSAPVKITYDERMVPHIFAENIHDALFTQGYILAQDRLWQMDISTRSTGGRLAEVMGPQLLNRDKEQRRKGLTHAAENALKTWKEHPEHLKLVESYTAGVNAYINNLTPKDYPIEFKLLNYEPEPWTLMKSAILIRAMSQMLAIRENDLELSNTLTFLGQETFDFLFPGRNPKDSPIIPEEVKWDFDPIPIKEDIVPTAPIGYFEHPTFTKASDYIGSNNWAVAGSKTASGHPILCNDPHLMLTLPSIWYEIQIKTPQFNCYGVCLAGFPGITIGFNEHVAWGMTNVGQDITDMYRIKWVDDQKESYWLDGKQVKVEKRIETFKIKGGKTIQDTIRFTHWGPVVYESPDHPQKDLAMRWIAHDPGSDELSVFYKLNAAKNYDDYHDALQHFDTPAQNIIFASQEGDIALKVQGKFPLKQKNQGRFVQDGSSTANAWKGFIPKAHIPQVKNPAQAYIASANQHSTAEDYPYYYNGFSGDGFGDYRGRIVNEKLASMEQIKAKDMMDLQNDVEGLKAREALPLLIQNLDKTQLSEKEKSYLAILEKWDFHYRKEEKAPILFDEWYDDFYWKVWDEFDAIRDSIDILSPKSWLTISLLEEQPDYTYFDLVATKDKVETAKDIATISFRNMVKKVTIMEEEAQTMTWSAYKGTNINHIGRIPAFSVKNVDVGGDGQALNAIRKGAGPSWRMIVEFGEEIKAYGVYPGGQSGNPGSPYYDNAIDSWADGKYYDLLLLKSPVDEGEQILGMQTFEKK